MKTIRWFVRAGLPVLVFAAAHVQADSVVITTNKDNTLYEDPTGSISNGAGPAMYAGTAGVVGQRRGVMAFDITGNVPAGSTINSVTLELYLARLSFQSPGPQPATLHKIMADWGEGSSDAGDPGGSGAPSTTGDATWIHRMFNTTFWTTQGGDFMATASASIIDDDSVGSHMWSSTPAMVADVQDWLDNPANNFGWLIKGGETMGRTARQWSSRESMDPPPSHLPRLTIDFTPPASVPAISTYRLGMLGLLLLLAGIGISVRYRRAARVGESL